MTRGRTVASYRSRAFSSIVYPLRCELRWRQVLAQVPADVRTNVEPMAKRFDPLLGSIRRLCLRDRSSSYLLFLLSRIPSMFEGAHSPTAVRPAKVRPRRRR